MSLIVHTFHDTAIRQVAEDGYIHATPMCKAHGKKFAGYFRLKSTQEYLAALSSVVQIHTTELVRSIQGGDSKLQGTWVHPKVAIHLAQWCSPEFAVFVSNLVYDWMSNHAVVTPPSEAAFAETVANLVIQKLSDAQVLPALMPAAETFLTEAEVRRQNLLELKYLGMPGTFTHRNIAVTADMLDWHKRMDSRPRYSSIQQVLDSCKRKARGEQ